MVTNTNSVHLSVSNILPQFYRRNILHNNILSSLKLSIRSLTITRCKLYIMAYVIGIFSQTSHTVYIFSIFFKYFQFFQIFSTFLNIFNFFKIFGLYRFSKYIQNYLIFATFKTLFDHFWPNIDKSWKDPSIPQP